MEIPAKCVAATVLLLNIAVGIGVICLVLSREHHEHRKTSEILKQQFSRIYTEHLKKFQATFTNAGTTDTSEDTPIRNWVPFIGPGRQLLYNGMKYENGSIIVPATGVYVVYSHVKFYTERNRQGDSESDFHHNIARYSALKQEEETVLRDVISENKNNIIDGASLEYSSDIHGLVQLDAGDQLMVKVSGMNPLTHDRDWHYVGVYLT
ncbi:tumor necrosis factor-like isoform X3 [Haliotis rubra]|uniref:tumor necrosis factor-like isoform X3 n=1 Tax=Haliotis rubra TaxID=36100 RepID=UPI001EE52510|nr:tumor necrosis factor-like isoform X3 [Haliotis rubra]